MDWTDLIKRLKPCTFKWPGMKRKTFGVIAQDLRKVFPESEYTIVCKNAEGYYTVDYGQLGPLLVKGFQELEERVRQLEEQNAVHK